MELYLHFSRTETLTLPTPTSAQHATLPTLKAWISHDAIHNRTQPNLNYMDKGQTSEADSYSANQQRSRLLFHQKVHYSLIRSIYVH